MGRAKQHPTGATRNSRAKQSRFPTSDIFIRPLPPAKGSNSYGAWVTTRSRKPFPVLAKFFLACSAISDFAVFHRSNKHEPLSVSGSLTTADSGMTNIPYNVCTVMVADTAEFKPRQRGGYERMRYACRFRSRN